MTSSLFIPPIKCQGIKTKLVPTIQFITTQLSYKRWVEPFLGSGVVGFNIRPPQATFADNNPHLINFYNALKEKRITPSKVKIYLEKEGALLEKSAGEYYYEVRERFNSNGESLDFLFLNRACFNGLMRFNSKGKFNVPFCHKPQRFAPAYITKIVNQIKNIQEIIIGNNYQFYCQTFAETLKTINDDDLIYCDPPYIGRHVDYYDSWNEQNELSLHHLLFTSPAKFIFSTWHSNQFRKNSYLETIWSIFPLLTKEHFYHIGGNEENRNPMIEAIVTNFEAQLPTPIQQEKPAYQISIF